MSSSNPQLKQAYDLIKAGQKTQAVSILRAVLRNDRDNADAWWLMANALAEPDDVREALENVLRLRPANTKAQAMLDKLNARYPPRRKNDDDEFAFDDDDDFDFDDDLPQSHGGRVPVTRPASSGPSTLLIVLAIVGGLAVFSCVACLIATSAGVLTFGRAIEQVVTDPTFAAVMEDFAQSVTVIAGSQRLPADANMRGSIRRGQTVTGNVDTFRDDGWTLEGELGSSYIIELNARDSTLDPQLYIYNPDGRLLAENDDIDFSSNRNSRLEITLPVNGIYTIIVSAFGQGGAYELIVR
jgi:hypothetical protein